MRAPRSAPATAHRRRSSAEDAVAVFVLGAVERWASVGVIG